MRRLAQQIYERTRKAKLAHARRQARYRARRAKRVTHPGPASCALAITVRAPVAHLTVEAPIAASRIVTHEILTLQYCSFCRRPSHYVRAQTLAKLPRTSRSFRLRGPP